MRYYIFLLAVVFTFISCGEEEATEKIKAVKCETNEDCGFGICEVNDNVKQCKCNEGYLKKSIDFNKETCIENICTNSSYCKNTELEKDGETIITKICSSQGICDSNCLSDFDCFGETTVCFEGYQCVDMKSISCVGGEYVDPYYKRHEPQPDQSLNDAFCASYCNEQNPCQTGFVCNNSGKCLLSCETNEDCSNDKFSSGDFCNTELKYCENE